MHKMTCLGRRPWNTDSNGLHDASMSPTLALGKTNSNRGDQRKPGLRAAESCWCWTNNLQLLSDGITKANARPWFVACGDIMRRASAKAAPACANSSIPRSKSSERMKQVSFLVSGGSRNRRDNLGLRLHGVSTHGEAFFCWCVGLPPAWSK